MESEISFSLGTFGSNALQGFSMDYIADIRFMPYSENFWGSISYEMSLARHKYTK